MKNFNKNHLFAFCGFLVVTYLLWNRLVGVRLPKDLPLILINYQIIILLSTCIILIVTLCYIIITKMLKKRIKSDSIILQLYTFYYESLYQFDYKIKTLPYIWKKIKPYHRNILFYFRDHPNIMYIFLYLNIIKIIPPTVLVLDVFYYHEILYFYKSLMIIIFPLSYRYIYHSLHLFYVLELDDVENILDIRTQEKSENNTFIEYKTINGAVHHFIQETTQKRLGNRETIDTFHISLSKDFMRDNPKKDFQKIFNFYYKISLSMLSDYYAILNKLIVLKQKYDPYINSFSLTMLIICWVYILFTSNIILTENFVTFWLEIQAQI